MTRQGNEPQVYRLRSGRSNHYTIAPVACLLRHLDSAGRIKQKRKEAAKQENLLAKIPKLGSHFRERASFSQLSASDTISSDPEDYCQARWTSRGKREWSVENSADKRQPGDPIAEALVQTLENSLMILGQWGKINDNNIECWAKKSKRLHWCLKKAPDDTQASRSYVDA